MALGLRVHFSDYKNSSKERQQAFLGLFVEESNLIEGIASPMGQTIVIYGGETLEDASRRHFPLTYHHKDALEYVVEHAFQRYPSIDDINHLHRTLLRSQRDDAGSFRQRPVYIRLADEKTITFRGMPYYRQVPRLMREFENEVSRQDSHYLSSSSLSLDEIMALHHHFVSIHPYSDGNGRTARLLLNWLSLRHQNTFVVVRNRHKQSYYDDIASFQNKFRKVRTDIGFYKDAVYDRKSFERERYLKMLRHLDTVTPLKD